MIVCLLVINSAPYPTYDAYSESVWSWECFGTQSFALSVRWEIPLWRKQNTQSAVGS